MKTLIFALVFLFSNVCFAQVNISAVKSYKNCRNDFALKLCKGDPNTYSCFRFSKKGQDYVKWNEMFPVERVRTLVQKVNRRNSLVWRNHCVAIPNDLNKDVIEFAPFRKKLFNNPPPYYGQHKIIIVDLEYLAFGAYKGNELIYWGPANGGMGKCRETGKYTCKTPAGTWKIYEIKRGFQRSDLYPVECVDKKKCGHPYFNVMKWGPHYEAFHGEKEGHVPGANVSHGGVRMFLKDSRWLIDNFVEMGTQVLVFKY